MRFFILYPERRSPGGGHKQMRILAQNLRKLGEESFLLRKPADFDDNGFYGVEVPSAPFGLDDAGREISPDDVVLMPEILLEHNLALARRWRGRKAVYAQGGFLALLYRPRGGYTRCGLDFMIGVSPYIVALARPYLGLEKGRSFLVPYPVVRGAFAEPIPPFNEKDLAICCMPRKLPDHIREVQRIVSQRYPQVPWVAIDGVPETEVAKVLTQNAIFFATQNGEGFGLPAAEAMSRGCVATGYRGTGLFPHPYANSSNGLWARDRSIGAAARQLCRAIEIAQARDLRLEQMQSAARGTLQGFTEEVALTALAHTIEAIKADYRGRPASRCRLGIKGHLQALRVLQVSRRIRQNIGAGPGAVAVETT